MKRPALASFAALALAALGLGAGAGPALAANHVINLTGPPTAPLGQPMAIRASGVVAPPEEFWDLSWIEAVEISAGVVPECPPDAGSAGVLAEETGGNILSIALRPYMDEAGNFSNTVGYYEAPAGGSAGGSGTGPGSTAGPVNVSLPWISRAGRRLVCHPGSWSGAGGSYSYGWFLDRRLTRVTGARPLAPQGARGHTVRCRVTAAGPGGKATAISRPLRLR